MSLHGGTYTYDPFRWGPNAYDPFGGHDVFDLPRSYRDRVLVRESDRTRKALADKETRARHRAQKKTTKVVCKTDRRLAEKRKKGSKRHRRQR